MGLGLCPVLTSRSYYKNLISSLINLRPNQWRYGSGYLNYLLSSMITQFQRVGREVGKLLKIDARTFSTLRGRYAYICVQVPLDTLVKSSINIGNHQQMIHYEREGFLCKICGHLGHTLSKFLVAQSKMKDNRLTISDLLNPAVEEWKTVTFNKKKDRSNHLKLVKHRYKTSRLKFLMLILVSFLKLNYSMNWLRRSLMSYQVRPKVRMWNSLKLTLMDRVLLSPQKNLGPKEEY